MGIGVAVSLVAWGCAPEEVATGRAELVGGAPTSEYPAALFLTSSQAFCTGSLVAPNVVLTAAHCGLGPGWTATVMDVDEPVASEEVVEAALHRYHDGNGQAVATHDISVARLAADLPVEPFPFITERLDPYPLESTVVAVGFGLDDGVAQTGGGVKRAAPFTVTWATDDYFVGGERGTSVCSGDSGGPGLRNLDGVPTVVGVTAAASPTCRLDSRWTRVDAYAAEFVIPFVDAWSGPCRFDGTCAVQDCRTPDPDCAPCGIDGVCSAGCATLDLDCPVAGLFGDACGSPDDCESRLCIDDGEGGQVCTRACDDSETFCPSGHRCEPVAEATVCVPDRPEEGGGCSAGGAGGGALGALALLLLSCLACGRAPRRRCRCPGIP